MPRITARRNDQLCNTAPLQQGDTVVGRDEDVDFFLGDHPGISRHHLVIRYDGRRLVVRALVDGVLVSGYLLRRGEERAFDLGEWIAVGPYVITVHKQTRRSTVATVPMDAPRPRDDDSGVDWCAVLTFESGPRAGERVVLPPFATIGGPYCSLGLGLPDVVGFLRDVNGHVIVSATPRRLPVTVGGRPVEVIAAAHKVDRVTFGEHAFRLTSEPVWAPVLPAEAVGGMIGKSAPMRTLFKEIRRLAPFEKAVVLVVGQTGSGKEHVTRALHDQSPRAAGPYRVVNCATFGDDLIESELFGHEKGAFTGATRAKKGLFREAAGGTLVLDEFGTLSLAMQATLLRALAQREIRSVGGSKTETVDTRVILSTNLDLAQAVEDGTFREDILYRVSGLVIAVPPLAARMDDVPLIARWYLAENFPGMALSDGALDRLLAHRWPGNVRELLAVLAGAAPRVDTDEAVIRAEHIRFVDEIYAELREQVAGPPPFTVPVATLVPKDIATMSDEELSKLRAEHSEEELAQILGASRGKVRYWLAKRGHAGVRRPGRPPARPPARPRRDPRSEPPEK